MPNCKTILNLYQTILTAKHTFDASLSSAKIKTPNPDVKSGSRLERRDKQPITQAVQSLQSLKQAYTHLKDTLPQCFPQVNPSFTHTTAEGNKETISIEKEIAYWSNFYQRNNYHWVNLPKSITLAPDQIKQMQELINQGFTKMIIIPENLVDNPQITKDNQGKRTIKNPSYERLHLTASQGYKKIHTWDNYQKDGNFQGSKDKTISLCIILTKDIQNIDQDPIFAETKDKSIEQLENDPKFSHLLNLTESAYLVHQQEYNQRTNKHLDDLRTASIWYTWLPGSERPLSGRVPDVYWYPGGGQLHFGSDPRDYHSPNLGCRLAGGFEVKI